LGGSSPTLFLFHSFPQLFCSFQDFFFVCVCVILIFFFPRCWQNDKPKPVRVNETQFNKKERKKERREKRKTKTHSNNYRNQAFISIGIPKNILPVSSEISLYCSSSFQYFVRERSRKWFPINQKKMKGENKNLFSDICIFHARKSKQMYNETRHV
jgi:hypothetical protein